jgi:hypothetical protein
MTEQMPYTVVAKRDGYELRHYDPAILVQVTVTGDAQSAGSMGFGSLVRYISGDNEPGRKMAMTSPVLQESAHSSSHVVSFVLPVNVSVDDIPRPRDARVSTVAVPSRDMAARTYIGRWTQRKFEDNAEQLVADLARDGISAVGLPSWARYDPPWTPPFLRRNEVLVEVVASVSK